MGTPGARRAGSGDAGVQAQALALCPVFWILLVQGMPSPVSSCGSSLDARLPSDANRTHHHAGGAQRVAGALEVVPADAIELAHVVVSWVVDAVEV